MVIPFPKKKAAIVKYFVSKVKEKTSFWDTCEALHVITREHNKVYYYGRIIKLAPGV